MNLLDRINKLCKHRKMKIAELERKLEFGNASVSRWDKRSPRFSSVVKVADFFGVSVDSLAGRNECRCFDIYESRVEEAQEILSKEDLSVLIELIVKRLKKDDITFNDQEISPELRKIIMNTLNYGTETWKAFQDRGHCNRE